MREPPLDDPEVVSALSGMMRLLGDPTRLRLLSLLRPGELNVSALCRRLELAQPTVSHHLGLLRTAELVVTRRDGKQIFYALNPAHLSGSNGGLHLDFEFGTLCLGCRSPETSAVS